MRDAAVRRWSVLLLLSVHAGCAHPTATAARPAPPPVEAVVLPVATSAPGPADAAPPLDPEEALTALARAYATDDREAQLAIARRVLSAPPADAGIEGDGPGRERPQEQWSRSSDGARFAATMPTGLYLGTTRIEALLPELGSVETPPEFLPDPNYVAIRRPAATGSDACRWDWPEEDQPQYWVVDFNTHKVILGRRGRLLGASPDRTSLLLSDGSESKLTLYNLATHEERAVLFDLVSVRGNPLPWKPASCNASCDKDGCENGAPSPWDLRRSDVAFSPDGARMALNWNGFSRGLQQGVSVHDARTGAMVASFVSLIKATLLFSPRGALLVLLSSPKAKPPYHNQDTLLVLDGGTAVVHALTGCAFATDRELHLGSTADGARVAVRWDLSGNLRNSEACEFDLPTSRFVGKIHPGDPHFDDFRFDDAHIPPRSPFDRLRLQPKTVCARRGYLFPTEACTDAGVSP